MPAPLISKGFLVEVQKQNWQQNQLTHVPLENRRRKTLVVLVVASVKQHRNGQVEGSNDTDYGKTTLASNSMQATSSVGTAN